MNCDPKLKVGSEGNSQHETYYRTMSQADYDQLRMTGELPLI